jgi:S-adenosyl-L-methionine hydrolase (adenosine-forming)
MAIVTITSDWNRDDYYTASVKGKILNRCPGTTFIDITNKVPAFNIALAAFQLRYSCRNFPPETIHIVAVNNNAKEPCPYVALISDQQYFIGYNNGIFGLLPENNPEEIVALENKFGSSFPELDIFADAACEIILSKKFSSLGRPVTELCRQVPVLPAIDESVIHGSVIYIDSYRNAFTNITHELFDRIGKGRLFEIYVQSNHNRITQLNVNYNESSPGELLAIFNSLGLLEIAINGGNAADLLNLSYNSSVRLKFNDKK